MDRVRRHLTQLVHRVESALEIKNRGRYSVERLAALAQYGERATPFKKTTVLALTPFPALIMLFLMDIPKLAPPEAGWNHNHRFWMRAATTAVLLIGTLLLQLQCFLPRLHATRQHTVIITAITASVATSFTVFLSSQVGFPLPFTITAPGPVTISCMSTCAYVAWGDTLRRSQQLRRQLLNFVMFLSVQYMMTIVYPVVAFAFNRADSIVQTLLACSQSLIKLTMKLWLSRSMVESVDLRPILLTFNVEVFHALFVACCMQNAVSLSTTAAILALDAYHSWRNLGNLNSKMKILTTILNEKSATSGANPIEEFDFVAFAVHMLRDSTVVDAVEASKPLTHPRDGILPETSTRNIAQIFPGSGFLASGLTVNAHVSATATETMVNVPCTLDAATRTRLDGLPLSDKVEFVSYSLSFLHVTEHVVLAEYIEVVVPIIYVLYLATVFRLPNKEYYPQLRDMTEEKQFKAITSVLAYASLELVSFVVLDTRLRRKLKFTPLRQLAFVLGHHWWLLPGKLLLWVTFVLQASLAHFALLVIGGTDLLNLAPPEDGYKSSVFYIRVWMVATFMIGTLMLQLSIFLPGLNMRLRDIALITLFTTCTTTALMVALASQIGFPLPFTITIVSPYTMTCLCSCAAFRYGRQLLGDETLRRQLLEYGIFMSVQYTVTLVYPIFAFIFMQVDSVVLQTLLACVLPLTKLIIKVIMSRAMPSLPHLRPAFLMFNVEVFNALFISSCLQNASSVITTIVVMALDMFFNALTLRDVSKRLSALNDIVNTGTKVHDESKAANCVAVSSATDLIECAEYLLRDESNAKAVGGHTATNNHPPHIHVQSFAQVVPVPASQVAETEGGSKGTTLAVTKSHETSTRVFHRASLDSLASKEKVKLARGVLELLYVTEFVILTEYVEVVVPVIYAVFLSVVYQLPNRAYYPQLRSVSAEQNAVAIQRVLVYASLEFVSFLIFQRLLLRKMTLDPLRQLGFVLLEQCWFLPCKLMLWVAFILQCSTEHYGVDYTFQFKWLRHHERGE